MNISCIICSDLFLPISELYSTTCGHMFHYVCLMQWIERSKTCPQCRHKCNEKSIHRIYLNLQNTYGTENDSATLQMRLENMELQTRLKERDIKECISSLKKSKEQNVGLRDEVKSLEIKQKVSDSAISALKDQISYFKTKAKENERLSNEVHRLKDRLRDVENVELVLHGSKDKVNEMLRQNNDPTSLSILVSSLKNELIDSDKKKQLSYSRVYKMQNEIGSYKRECSEMAKQNQKLKSEVEAHQHCERQRLYYKQKITELEGRLSANSSLSYTPNKSIRRIIGESPAPMLSNPKLDDSLIEISLDQTDSPTVLERVKAIQDSDSPYLNVKSSSVGLNSLLNAKFSVPNSSNRTANPSSSNKFSIFKEPHKFDQLKPKQDYSYDGFGGQIKEDKYPSGNRPPIALKRSHKSSSSIPSSKFRKLSRSANTTHTSILDYIDKSN